MNLYRLIAQLLAFIGMFIVIPLILISTTWPHGLIIVFFLLMIAWSIASKKAGKKIYDERELRINSRAHGLALVLSTSYVMLIAMISREFDLGFLLPLAIYSIVPFQIIMSIIIFELLKRKPNAEGDG